MSTLAKEYLGLPPEYVVQDCGECFRDDARNGPFETGVAIALQTKGPQDDGRVGAGKSKQRRNEWRARLPVAVNKRKVAWC